MAILKNASFANAIIAQGEARKARKSRKSPDVIDWTHINNDVNGNPRYVCAYFWLNTEEERTGDVSAKYGGIVFTSYNLHETTKHIARVTGRNVISDRS
jgi:hypothetical protein